jgi:hypothetical protein
MDAENAPILSPRHRITTLISISISMCREMHNVPVKSVTTFATNRANNETNAPNPGAQ